VAILVGAGWLIYTGATSPTFSLSRTVIRGDELVPTDAILARLPVAGTNIFTVRAARVAREVENIPAIERAEVGLALPSTIQVTILERKPKAIWEAGGRQRLVDSNGLVLADVADITADSPLQSTMATIPTVHAPDSPIADPGEKIDPDVILMAELIAKKMDGITLPTGQVEYHPSTGLTLVVPGAYRVVLGSGGDVDAKVLAYRTIRNHLERTNTVAQLIDVRFLERPYYR